MAQNVRTNDGAWVGFKFSRSPRCAVVHCSTMVFYLFYNLKFSEMAKLIIRFPQIVVEFIEIDIDDEKVEHLKNMTAEEKAAFTETFLTENQIQNCPDLDEAFEYDTARFFIS